MVKSETLEKVADTVNIWVEGLNEKPISDYETNLTEYCNLDSLDAAELVIELEEKFDINISDEDVEMLFKPKAGSGEYALSNTPQQGSINSIAQYIDKRLQNP